MVIILEGERRRGFAYLDMFSLYCSKSEFLMSTVEKKLHSSLEKKIKIRITGFFFARFFSERFIYQKEKKKKKC